MNLKILESQQFRVKIFAYIVSIIFSFGKILELKEQIITKANRSLFNDEQTLQKAIDEIKDEGAKNFLDMKRITHNFVNPHMSLSATPAEEAVVDLNLGRQKLYNLIRYVATQVPRR